MCIRDSYDTVARRNLLMEPAINADLTHRVKAPDDLTFELFADLGWRFPDADGDGYADDEDCNATSIVTPRKSSSSLRPILSRSSSLSISAQIRPGRF